LGAGEFSILLDYLRKRPRVQGVSVLLLGFIYLCMLMQGFADFSEQEDYATKHNVSEEDRMAIEDGSNKPVDPMQGLEGLDQAGPKLN
jgi:hypothetical protein